MRRLRHSLLILWLIAVAVPAWAQDTAPISPADQTAIHKVVQSQLDAFQKDDGAAAFGFATPDLRQRFETVENFMAMVRDRYPAVYRPSQVTFGALENSDGSIVQHVLVVGPDGNLHEALYFMERQKDGTWLIGGCLLMTSDLKSS
jgi:hypothetical protein